MAGSSLPFLVFLFVSTPSLSFLHATFTFLTTLFPSLTPFFVSSSPSFLTHHSNHIIYPPCHWQRVKVLLAIMERRSLLMTTHGGWEGWGDSPFQIELFRGGERESRPWQWMPSSHRSMARYPLTLPGGTWWLFASSAGLCLAISRIAWFWHFLGSVGFLYLWSQVDMLPMPILFEFGSGTSLSWKESVDKEFSNTIFMGVL